MPGPVSSGGAPARLRIMATTDLHMHLTSFDYCAERPDPSVGLTRTASLIHAARDEARADNMLSLLLDNGDGTEGNPLGEVNTERVNRKHPLMSAFGLLGYDAIGLGNHDFNHGLSTLQSVLAQSPCPVVCSNMAVTRDAPVPEIVDHTILDRMVPVDDGAADETVPIRIGILSFLPPQTAIWDAHLLAGDIQIDDILASARRQAPKLRAQGCDLIIALAHSGLDTRPRHDHMENAVVQLAEIEEIDVLIAGHTHLHLPGEAHRGIQDVDWKAGRVHGKPAVMPGSAGSHLGVIDLNLEHHADQGWLIRDSRCELRPVARRFPNGEAQPLVSEDIRLVRALEADHEDTILRLSRPVGHSEVPLHSHFAFIAPDRSLAVVAAAQAATVRRYCCDDSLDELPLISAVAPGKFGGRSGPTHYTDVPAGPLCLRHLADLHVFTNDICAVRLKGARLRDWIERSASLFHQVTPGSKAAPLLDQDMPGYDFDVFFGLTYRIDLTQPARYQADGRLRKAVHSRVRDLCWRGQPVQDDQDFIIAVNSYRASAGGRVQALDQAERMALPPIDIRRSLIDYVARKSVKDPLESADPPWSFVPMPGTRVRLPVGPGALPYLPEIADRDPALGEISDDGFVTLEITP